MYKRLTACFIVAFCFIGCGSSPQAPAPKPLPVERYGTDPDGYWDMINNSSQPIILSFKNGLTSTLRVEQRKRITVKELIDSGCPLEEQLDKNYQFSVRYPGAPNKDKRIFSFKVITENGAKVKKTDSIGVVIFLDDSGTSYNAVKNASQTIMESLAKDSKVAIVNISSSDKDESEFVVGELEVFLVNGKCNIIDRRELDRLRKEQNFQLSGDVDDNDIVSIGKFAGADIVITGTISGTGSNRRLRLRALNTQTARVVAAASEAY